MSGSGQVEHLGIEYRLTFEAPNAEAVAAVLRRLPASRESDAEPGRFDLGESEWPEAVVQVEQGGAYYCDNCGGRGRELLGVVVARLVAVFGPVTVTEQ